MGTKFIHIKRSIAAVAACLLVLGSCRKEQDVYKPYGETVGALRSLMTKLATDPANSAEFLIGGGQAAVEFASPRDIRVLISDVNDLFATQGGTPVVSSASHPITLLVTDVFEKPEVTGLGTATQSDFGAPLATAGMVKIEAFLDGKPLKLLDGRSFEVRVPVGAAGFQPDFFIYEGGWSKSSSGESRFRWSQASDVAAPAIQPVPDGVVYYQLTAKKLGWLAANHPLPNPTTCIRVKLSQEFTLTNTLGFFVLSDGKSVFPLRYDSTNSTFKSEKVPLGATGKVVFSSKVIDQLYYGEMTVTTADDLTADLSQQMRPVGEAELKTALLGL